MPALLRSAVVLFTLAAGTAAAAEPTVRNDVTYRTVDGRPLKLDIAIPPGDGPFPALVFVHGGGWVSGNRGRYSQAIRHAAGRGYVAATVSYRLSQMGAGETSIDPFPAALQDVKSAIRFLRANAADYKLDPNRIGVVGDSAGGHLALMAGLTRPADGLDGDGPADAPPSDVQAVANLFGPSDFETFAAKDGVTAILLRAVIGAKVGDRPDLYRRASPIRYVRRDAPPILTLHGTADVIVPVQQSQAFDAAVKQAGGRHELVLLDGAGHGFRGPTAERAGDLIYAFFDRELKRGVKP